MLQGLALSNRPAQPPAFTSVRCCRDWHSQIGLHSHMSSLVSSAAGTGTLKSACTATRPHLCQMRQGLALSNRPAQPPVFTSVRCGRDWHSQIGLHSHPSSLVSDAAGTGTLKSASTATPGGARIFILQLHHPLHETGGCQIRRRVQLKQLRLLRNKKLAIKNCMQELKFSFFNSYSKTDKRH